MWWFLCSGGHLAGLNIKRNITGNGVERIYIYCASSKNSSEDAEMAMKLCQTLQQPLAIWFDLFSCSLTVVVSDDSILWFFFIFFPLLSCPITQQQSGKEKVSIIPLLTLFLSVLIQCVKQSRPFWCYTCFFISLLTNLASQTELPLLTRQW